VRVLTPLIVNMTPYSLCLYRRSLE